MRHQPTCSSPKKLRESSKEISQLSWWSIEGKTGWCFCNQTGSWKMTQNNKCVIYPPGDLCFATQLPDFLSKSHSFSRMPPKKHDEEQKSIQKTLHEGGLGWFFTANKTSLGFFFTTKISIIQGNTQNQFSRLKKTYSHIVVSTSLSGRQKTRKNGRFRRPNRL